MSVYPPRTSSSGSCSAPPERLSAVAASPAAVRLQRRLGYIFADPAWFGLALSHRSVGRDNNERLEFLGDALLGCYISKRLFERFPEAGEGALSRLRAYLVKGEALAAMAREMGLGDALNLGPGERRSGGASRDSILAGTLEAIIAAIHIDSGGRETERCLSTMFAERLATLTLERAVKDPKTRLQEWLQARGLPLPVYVLSEQDAGSAGQHFRVSCVVETVLPRPVEGEGASRRRAEQAAAERALAIVGADRDGGP